MGQAAMDARRLPTSAHLHESTYYYDGNGMLSNLAQRAEGALANAQAATKAAIEKAQGAI